MAAGRVRHWKHGWVPLDAYARAIRDGASKQEAQRILSAERAPNADLGLPVSSRWKDDRAGGVRRVQEIRDLLPDLNPRPHYQFPSQDMPGHFTGGVAFDSTDVDKLVDHLHDTEEGTTSRYQERKIEGLLPRNPNKGTREQVANRRAREIKRLADMKAKPYPEYDIQTHSHTGGLVFMPDMADELLKKLNYSITGTTTPEQAHRLAGGR